jgi:hypothetical protein
MSKVFLTMLFAFSTMFASAQFVALTTLNKVEGTPPNTDVVYEGDECPTAEDSYNITDKIGIGYQVNEKLMVGITKDGDDAYELLGRYSLMNGIWATCIYNYMPDSEDEMTDKLDLGVGYSYNVWKGLWIDPNYTMPLKEGEDGNREGSFNLSFSYKF